MTKKREKGEVMITKKIARACKRPVINHLVRGRHNCQWQLVINLARELCDQAEISSPLMRGMLASETLYTRGFKVNT